MNFFEYTKRLGQKHWILLGGTVQSGSITLCGRPCLGNNYASVLREDEKEECEECKEERAKLEENELILKGLIVYVYRNSMQDCTGGGVSSIFNEFVLTGPGIPEITEPRDGMPALELQSKKSGKDIYFYVTPIPRKEKGKIGPMMGGNLVSTSDSRFRSIFGAALPIHDRYETQEVYDALSR